MVIIYNVENLSKILNIGKNKTYELMKSKSFPSYRIGKQYFVTEDNLNKWLNSVTNKEVVLS